MFLRTKRTKTKKISVKVGKLKKETLVLLSKPIEENNSFLQFLRNNPNDFKFSKSDLQIYILRTQRRKWSGRTGETVSKNSTNSTMTKILILFCSSQVVKKSKYSLTLISKIKELKEFVLVLSSTFSISSTDLKKNQKIQETFYLLQEKPNNSKNLRFSQYLMI